MTLIKQEVSAKSGVSGTTVKLAYKTVNAFASGYVQSMVETLLPDMLDKLEPYWADFSASGAYATSGDYLVKRGDEVSESLLSVTDARRRASDRPTIIKAYRSVRGNAAKHVTAALRRRRRPGPEVRGLTVCLSDPNVVERIRFCRYRSRIRQHRDRFRLPAPPLPWLPNGQPVPRSQPPGCRP